ncbi:hypothetical protein ACQR18_27865 [Bradyrhizobium oligotrophicum]|uniref:hypothetical protein n=1 Tax=Bradyrhizobium oligotrophicum TaxID=44255 RepID=UPI003EB856D7
MSTYIASAAVLSSNSPTAICSSTAGPDGSRTGHRLLRRPGQLHTTKAVTAQSSAAATTRLSAGGQYSTQPKASGSIIKLRPRAVRLPSQKVSPVRKLILAMSIAPSRYGA